MATWTQTFSDKNKYSITLECSEQSYSIPNNTSVVSWKLTMATAANSFLGYSDYRTTISISINGTTVYSYNASRDFNPSAASSYSEVLASGTATVNHNADGTKTCACAASVTVASGTYSPGSASISQNLTLTTIPRASSCSWSGDFVIGTGKAITISSASNSFRHEFTFTVGSGTTSASVAAGTSSYTWTPASATFASQFPTQTSRTGTMVLKTYNGATLIGSVTYSFTLKIPDSWKPSTPSITLSPVNTNAFINGQGIYVMGYTKTRVRATSTASSGTTISSWTVSGAASLTQSGSSLDKTSGIIASSGSKTFTVTVTDARGRTAQASASVTYLAYSSPAVTSLTVARGSYVGGVWTASASGSDIKLVFKAGCSLSSNSNVMSWTIGSPVSQSGSSLANNGTITQYKTGVGTTTAYTITVTVTDSVGQTGTKSVLLATIEIPFVINPTMPAIGVGAVPQTARTLELASNWGFKPGIGIYGQKNNYSYVPSASGYHIIPLATYYDSYLGTPNDINATLQAILKRTCELYPNRVSCFFFGSIVTATRGYIQFVIYDTSDVDANGYPKYAAGECVRYAGYSGQENRKYSFGTINYVPYVHNDSVFIKQLSATFSVAAGTIGTRGGQKTWATSDIGGTPLYVQCVSFTSSANCWRDIVIDNGTVYVNLYRATASAFSETDYFNIFYIP